MPDAATPTNQSQKDTGSVSALDTLSREGVRATGT